MKSRFTNMLNAGKARAKALAGRIPKDKIRQHRKAAAVCGLALALVVGGSSAAFITQDANAADTEIKEYTASTGDISTTISGSGSLSTGSAGSVDIPVGVKIDEVLVSEGDQVKKGTKLASVDRASAARVLLDVYEDIDTVEDLIDELTDEEDTDSEDYLYSLVYNDQLDQLKALKKSLKTMVKTGYVKATKAGIIGTINVSDDSTVTAASTSSSTSSDASASGVSADSTTLTISTMAYEVTTEEGTETEDSEASTETAEAVLENAGETVSDSELVLSSDAETETTAETTSETSLVTISDDELDDSTVDVPQTGDCPQTSIDNGTGYTAKIRWNTSSAFKAGYTYSVTVTLTADSGYCFSSASDYSSILPSGMTLSSGYPKVTGGDSTEGNKLVFKGTVTLEDSSSSSSSSSTAGTSDSSSAKSSGASMKSGSSAGASSGSSGSSSSATTTSSTDTTESEVEIVDTVEAFTLASQDTMDVTVSVDESDINSVAKGQTAVVTMEALDGSFDGEITKVNRTASSSENGTAKYSVTVAVDKEDGMLTGMSASVVINIQEARDAVLIPSAAIVEEQGKTYVYTEKNSDGDLSGKTEITTGLSNGTQVQVTEGLSEGDTIYYQVTDSDSDEEDSASDKRAEMGGPEGGGEPPSGAPGGSGGPGGSSSGS